MTDRRLALDDGSLVDVLDRLVTVGAAVDGDVIITLADVDLIQLDLRLLLAAMRTDRPHGRVGAARPRASTHAAADHRGGVLGGAPSYAKSDNKVPVLAGEQRERREQPGLGGLVVAVVDLVRQLLERMALRRMEAGTLSADEVERLGRSLMALEQQTTELAEALQTRRPGGSGSPHREGVRA